MSFLCQLGMPIPIVNLSTCTSVSCVIILLGSNGSKSGIIIASFAFGSRDRVAPFIILLTRSWSI